MEATTTEQQPKPAPQRRTRAKSKKPKGSTTRPLGRPRALRERDRVKVISGVCEGRVGTVRSIDNDRDPSQRYFVGSGEVLGRFSSAELERMPSGFRD